MTTAALLLALVALTFSIGYVLGVLQTTARRDAEADATHAAVEAYFQREDTRARVVHVTRVRGRVGVLVGMN